MYASEKLDRNVSKDIKVPVLKCVHRSSNTNQSCVQRSQNPCNFEKVYYFVFKFLDSQHKISIVYDCLLMKTFHIFDNSAKSYQGFSFESDL